MAVKACSFRAMSIFVEKQNPVFYLLTFLNYLLFFMSNRYMEEVTRRSMEVGTRLKDVFFYGHHQSVAQSH